MSGKTLSDLNRCGKDDFVAVLSNIFEYSPWIGEQTASARPFVGVKQLFDAMKAAVDHAPTELRLALIKAHPDLADKTQRAAGLTAESNAEQNSVGLDRLSDAEYAAFERLNNAYRSKFGFPYIVCVRRHTKDSILRDFERRLPNDAKAETQTSIARNLPDRGAATGPACVVGRQARRCTGVCRPMCWIPIAASRQRGLRSSSRSSLSSALPAW